MASNSNGTTTADKIAQDVQEDIQEVLSDFGENFHEKANEARMEVVKHLRKLAESVKSNVRDKTDNDKVKAKDREQAIATADEFAERLAKTAKYLENHTVEEMQQNATETMQGNVWKTVFIAFVVGLILGQFFKRD